MDGPAPASLPARARRQRMTPFKGGKEEKNNWAESENKTSLFPPFITKQSKAKKLAQSVPPYACLHIVSYCARSHFM